MALFIYDKESCVTLITLSVGHNYDVGPAIL